VAWDVARTLVTMATADDERYLWFRTGRAVPRPVGPTRARADPRPVGPRHPAGRAPRRARPVAGANRGRAVERAGPRAGPVPAGHCV